MHKIRLGTNEDGTPLWHYQFDPDEVAVFTGPITGTVTLPDGQVVDVSDTFVAVPDQATADAVSDAIGQRHVEEGHPLFTGDPDVPSDGFVFVPTTEG